MESTNKLANIIEDRCETERTTPGMGISFFKDLEVGQRLSVNRKGSRWRKCGTMGLRGYSNPRQFQMCCLVKIAHYANQPR